MNKSQIGRLSEEKVCNYLLNNNYQILERNFRILDAEIDLIATNNNSINFIEVKKIPTGWDGVDMSAKINPQKISKIRKAASVYLAQYCKIKYDKISFDVAFVTNDDITLFTGAF